MSEHRWFSLLGPIQAGRGPAELSLGPAQQQALLAALLLRDGAHAALEELIDGLWGEAAPISAPGTVRTYISRLRRALGPGPGAAPAIRWLAGGYVMPLGPDELDVTAAQRHITAAGHMRQAGETAAAAEELKAALALWRGIPLGGLPGPLAERQRQHLTRLRAATEEEWLQAQLDLGHHAQVQHQLADLVTQRPLDERLREMLIIAQYRSGRQAAALATFHEGKAALAAQLGTAPGPSLQGLYERIVHLDPALQWDSGHEGEEGEHAGHAAPAGAGSPPSGGNRISVAQLPPELSVFSGRSAQLAEADALIASPLNRLGPVITLITGAAGVGKSTFAVHWAHRVAADFPDGQLYLDLRGFDAADTPVSAASAIRILLESLGIPPWRLPSHPDAQQAMYRSALAGRRLILLLDNARDAQQVRPLLVGGSKCLVIVTSRMRLDSIVAGEGAHPIQLDVLTADEAREMLARRLGPGRLSAEPAAAQDLLDNCARLPLAIAAVAARAAARPAFRLTDIATELRAARGSLDAFGSTDPAMDARSVFSWSYSALTAPAARLFKLLALHPGPQISLTLAASLGAHDRHEARRLLNELCEAVLLNETAPGRYSWHDLLRAYAGETGAATQPLPVRQEARRRLIDHYIQSMNAAAVVLNPHRPLADPPPPRPGVVAERPATYADALSWSIAEHPALLDIIAAAIDAGLHRHAWHLAYAAETFLLRTGRWRDWVRSQDLALAAAAEVGDPAMEAQAQHSLGKAYLMRGDHDLAARHASDAREQFRAAGLSGGEAGCEVTLGNIASAQGRRAAAISHFQAALEISAGEDVNRAAMLNNLGHEHALIGDHDRAIEFCQQARVIWAEAGDPNGQAHAWDSIGIAHQAAGRNAEAIAAYQKAIGTFAGLGSHHLAAVTLGRLGEVHLSDGRQDRARDAWSTAVRYLADSAEPRAESLRDSLRARLDQAPG